MMIDRACSYNATMLPDNGVNTSTITFRYYQVRCVRVRVCSHNRVMRVGGFSVARRQQATRGSALQRQLLQHCRQRVRLLAGVCGCSSVRMLCHSVHECVLSIIPR
jgi:hypothetical protein